MRFVLRSLCHVAVLSAYGLSPFPAASQWLPLNPIKIVEPQADGLLLTLENGYLRFQICSDSIVRVVYSLQRTPKEHADFLVVKKSWPKPEFSLKTEDPKSIVLTTPRLKIEVSRENSAIIFYDSAGQKLTQESTRTLTPAVVNGEKTLHSERFVNMWDTQEAFYGLGQHQGGILNYRGESVDIAQDNTNISVPFLLSSNGYGIFWNNGSRSRFNNRFVHALYIGSEVADSIDYYFLYGPDFDKIIFGYRELTGNAPCSVSGLTATGNAKTATIPNKNWKPLLANTAIFTSHWTTSFRIGSGGTRWESPSSTKIIPTPKQWWRLFTRTMSI
jgi:Domain of unknown function (DUF4968)/Galactose mutarotase-like